MYERASSRVIRDFEAVYYKITKDVENGKEPTPADLYKLDKYWEAQAQMRRELEKLGNKEIRLLSAAFTTNFFEIYYSIALPGEPAFNKIDNEVVQQLINGIWVADGKQWSQRVWDNTERLAQTLNEELIHIVTTGKKDSELKTALQERFGVSYHRAETLARTEVAHIQTEAAKKRYEDYGIEEVEVLVDPDDRTCELCKALIGKKFKTTETPPLPVHPNERCCLVPVIK
jgi:SPP1 gp7 family putative phage head morphogenesis protein